MLDHARTDPRLGPDQCAQGGGLAVLQDDGRFVMLLFTALGAFASLAAIVFELGASKGNPAGLIVAIVTIAFLTLFMLLEGPAWVERAYGLLPEPSQPRWRKVGRRMAMMAAMATPKPNKLLVANSGPRRSQRRNSNPAISINPAIP